MKRLSILLSFILLTGLSASCIFEENVNGYIVKTGDVAPDFSIRLTNGKSVSLNELSGKTVLLQFFSTTCPVCREESPAIENEIWQNHKENDDFFLLGINLMEDQETVMQYMDELSLTYPIGLDRDGSIFKLFAKENSGVTRNVLVGKDGKIIMLTRLFDREEFERLKERIIKELN